MTVGHTHNAAYPSLNHHLHAGGPTHQFVLDVQGMKCGGCSAAVKRILQQQDYVRSAGVNLITNTAAVGVAEGPTAEALAHRAAELLTSKGFPSTVRPIDGGGLSTGTAVQDTPSIPVGEDSALMLGFAWTLVAFCCLHHAGHALHDLGFHSIAHVPLLHAMGMGGVGWGGVGGGDAGRVRVCQYNVMMQHER